MTASTPQPDADGPAAATESTPPLTPTATPNWLLPVVFGVGGIVVGLALGAGAFAALNGIAAAEQPAAEESDNDSVRFEAYVTACGASDVAQPSDGGRTLVLDGEGQDAGSGNVTVEQINCILGATGAPDSVTSHMGQTRSLDGRQEDSWDDFSASWTYHPDAGLNIIIELDW